MKLTEKYITLSDSGATLCAEATAVCDMKNSSPTIRFFSDAKWNSPNSGGWRGHRENNKVLDLLAFLGLEPVKTNVWLNLSEHLNFYKNFTLEVRRKKNIKNLTSPILWLQSTGPHPLGHTSE